MNRYNSLNINKKYKILFICLGNICRSAAAESVMKSLVEKAGVVHRSRPVRPEDFDYFDLIIGMDSQNLADLRRRAPSAEAEQKIARMTDYCVRYAQADSVPDPYYGGAEGFEYALDLLEDACAGLLERLG